MGQRQCFNRPLVEAPPVATPSQPSGRVSRPAGQVQQAFAQQAQADWESVYEAFSQHAVVQSVYGELLSGMSAESTKILQLRTLVPIAKAHYDAKPASLPAKRAGILVAYKSFAEKKGIDWKGHAAQLASRGDTVWEAERQNVNRGVHMPEYYRACYDGPIHSYNSGNGEWSAAFDAPSAYLLVHLHHYPNASPQEAFDNLHEEFDKLALKHLSSFEDRPIRCADLGCGVGTSTFSTRRSLERAGVKGKVIGIDLSDYFIAVGQYIQKERESEFIGAVDLEFMHGNALDLQTCGFDNASLDLVMISEVTHEMPKVVSQALFREAARVLVPGGVLGYMDINPVQTMKDNPVGALVDRVATSNEPYFDQYLELDVAEAMKAAGLEVVEQTWPHHAKYPSLETCSLRFLVAKKPEVLSFASWTGSWALDRRENWNVYLEALGVPEAAWETATKAPDFHEYVLNEQQFFMDQRIPAKDVHLRFTGHFDNEWVISAYPKPTAKEFSDDSAAKKNYMWKHQWMKQPTTFETVLEDFTGPGKNVRLIRDLVAPNQIKMIVTVFDKVSGKDLVGPSYTWMKRTGSAAPKLQALEMKERFAIGVSRSLEWRLAAIDKVGAMVEENVEALSEAQAKDHVSPSNMMGAAMMMKGAVAFYKASLASWMEAQKLEETLPPFIMREGMQEGDWEIVPEPKGVGLVVAPWNAPALLCFLPMMGMLAAGNLCIIKPSEAAPATSRLVARLVAKYFPDRSVIVQEGGREIVEEIINAPVDLVLFTGGGEIAQKISALAAKHLTPVSLELGGKNPCFVDVAETEMLALYAAEIIGTKSYFAGQFCQAHDYLLVHEKVFDEFVKLLEEKITALGDARRKQLINARHANKVKSLMVGLEKYARPALVEVEDDCVPLTLFVEPPLEANIMDEEIFGPLLPVLKVSNVEAAAAFVRGRPKPLVAYCYSTNSDAWNVFRDRTSSGNLVVNCGPLRMQSNFNVGFGGVGQSGHGVSIWGKAVFEDYSHFKSVFKGKKFAGSVWGSAPPPPKGAGKGKK
eukprot:TRINITY_DN17784_c0_g2_i1.p1 TRINITY_DN17784_c0_g2~~TRINITY_DN17784_c0_g2_i1.p1  ORF type:complete len:1034 (-),score=181.64 TRINITY_DN17784_c0_g2_i1:301-3402(-)